jgi:hypothetical protein
MVKYTFDGEQNGMAYGQVFWDGDNGDQKTALFVAEKDYFNVLDPGCENGMEDYPDANLIAHAGRIAEDAAEWLESRPYAVMSRNSQVGEWVTVGGTTFQRSVDPNG